MPVPLLQSRKKGNPAILLDNPSFNKKIPTEVKIHLEGKLLKPDDPVFEINFPNTSGTAESELNYRLTDPQIRQLQSLSLLSQGIFINEVGVSMQGITNNLYQKASDVFTNLLGDDNEKLKIGVNYFLDTSFHQFCVLRYFYSLKFFFIF